MRLETVSKVKGWIAFVCLCVWIGGTITLQNNWYPMESLWYGGFAGLICIPVGISWFRGRKRMRELEYAGRSLAKGR
jgi:hypothetical protein